MAYKIFFSGKQSIFKFHHSYFQNFLYIEFTPIHQDLWEAKVRGPKYLIGFISHLCWIAATGEGECVAAVSVDHLLPVLCVVMWRCQQPLPCHWLRVLLNL